MLFLFIYFLLNTSLDPINVKFDTKNIVRTVLAMIFHIQQMYVDTVNFCDRLYIHTHRYTINHNNHYSKVEILKAKHIVSEEVMERKFRCLNGMFSRATKRRRKRTSDGSIEFFLLRVK